MNYFCKALDVCGDLATPFPESFSRMLKNDKLWHEAEEYFLYVWLHKYVTLY